MSERYKGKYSVRSNRLQGYDYSSEGAYFITICTAKHSYEFGEIKTNEIIHSDIGKIADQIWSEIPNQFPYIILGEYITMPNHIHGILIINHIDAINRRDAINRVSTSQTNKIGGVTGNKNPMLQNNISRVIRWYKGRVSFDAHKIYAGFAWQSNYYDHIIRDQKAYTMIENYIRNNPLNWKKDKFFMNL